VTHDRRQYERISSPYADTVRSDVTPEDCSVTLPWTHSACAVEISFRITIKVSVWESGLWGQQCELLAQVRYTRYSLRLNLGGWHAHLLSRFKYAEHHTPGVGRRNLRHTYNNLSESLSVLSAYFSHPMSLEPTFHGYVATSNDALLLFEAARSNGILSKVTRRPDDRERDRLIKSGSIFVFEQSTGIRRWPDCIAWAPSTILGNYLIYRQLERPLNPDYKKRARHRLSSVGHRNHLPLDSPSLVRSPSQREAGGPNRAHSKEVQSESSKTSDKDSIHDKPRRWSEEQEIELAGSLAKNGFKEGGLIKKTMSVEYEGAVHHLVSYFTIDDVMLNRLPRPSQDPRVANLVIGDDLLNRTNFRVQPSSEAALSKGSMAQTVLPQQEQHTADHSGQTGYSYGSNPPPVASMRTDTSHSSSVLGVDYPSTPYTLKNSPPSTQGAVSTLFDIEYPKAAAEALLRNQTYLENLVPKLGWQFEFSAGYDFIPENYRKEASDFMKKHDQSRQFTGNAIRPYNFTCSLG
jgi:hypothetical protein